MKFLLNKEQYPLFNKAILKAFFIGIFISLTIMAIFLLLDSIIKKAYSDILGGILGLYIVGGLAGSIMALPCLGIGYLIGSFLFVNNIKSYLLWAASGIFSSFTTFLLFPNIYSVIWPLFCVGGLVASVLTLRFLIKENSI